VHLIQKQRIYEFAGFRLDAENRRLTRDGAALSLTPKEFDVLLFLIENAGRAIGKNEILDRVWANTYVEEATPTRNVSWLRKKLVAQSENDSDETKFIKTVPKRGYRFLPGVVRSVEGLFARSNGGALIIEEEIIQQIQIEETCFTIL
jgi:DNA-binding winged helix-turn-helix (wHTH) protein